jgi:hypothetical protein
VFEEVIIVRSGGGSCIGRVDDGIIDTGLFSPHSLREINGKVAVTAARSVTIAIVRACCTLAGTAFVSREANAFASRSIANATIGAVDFVAVIKIGSYTSSPQDLAPTLATGAGHQRAISTTPQLVGVFLSAFTVAGTVIHRVAGTVPTACVRACGVAVRDESSKKQDLHVR